MSLIGPILWQGIKMPRRVAVMDDQRSYTYSQLLGGSMFLADQIESVTSAKHVGILLPTSGTFPMALLGAWVAGRVAVPLNYLLAPDELRYVIADSDIDTIITVGPMLDFLNSSQASGSSPPGHTTRQHGLPEAIPDGIRLLRLEQCDFSGMPPFRWPACPGRDDLAVILYTSGTSGRPKGVMLTHSNLQSNVDAAIVHANIKQADTFLGVLPQFHSFGLTALTLIPLRIGAKVVYTARFVPKKIVALIRRHRPDNILAVPSMYGALLSVKNASSDDFSSIRLAISGGEPLPAATYETFLDRFNVKILEGYGLTETAPITNWSTPTRFVRRAVGPTLPDVEQIVVDDHDLPLPPGQEGQILIAGPNIMKGYYKLPDQTRQVFVEIPTQRLNPASAYQTQGLASMQTSKKRFFRTGDIGHIDAEGFLFITGRKKEMLIIGGENVFPREIEEVLNRHPSVRDSAVIGKTDGMRGEVPVAFIELNDDATFNATALRSWCRDSLAGYKVPREIQQINALPRSPTGKILRRQLKAG